MAERQTIADSKQAFHKAFPYVIAPLYRRLADELLVELHLLSHQTHFHSTSLFAVGLQTVFDTFTQGYKPQEQTQALYAALCACNGFDAAQLAETAKTCLDAAAEQSIEAIGPWLESLRLNDGAHYSRLMAIGLFRVMQLARGDSQTPTDEALRDQCKDAAQSLNFPQERLEKDLAQFAANSERMTQAVDLMQETIAAERRKKERRLAEQKKSEA